MDVNCGVKLGWLREEDDYVGERERARLKRETELRELSENPISEKVIWVQSVYNKNVFISGSFKNFGEGWYFDKKL